MAVTVTDSPDPVVAGTSLTYTITVTNNGPDSADVTLADTVPPGTTFRSIEGDSGFTCTTPAQGATGSISCSKASFAAGASATFTLVVDVNSDVAESTQLSDTATVSTSATDPTSGNNADTETTNVATSADIGVAISDSPDPVAPGGMLTYTISITNSGPSDAASASFTDKLPPEVAFMQLTQDSGPAMSCSTPPGTPGGTVDCSIASLPAGATASFTLLVSVDPAAGGTLTNSLSGSSSTPDPYSEAANNDATATTEVLTAADLSVTKTDSPDPVEAGGDITYTITVTNNGPGSAGNGVLTEAVPSGTTFVSISGASMGGPTGECEVTPELGSTGQIECSLPTLASGDVVTYTLTVHVLETENNGATITNTASVGSSTNADPNPANDSATATTAVHASADLVATSSDSPDPVFAGANLTYTINVADNGPASAHGVTLADALPAGTTFVSLAAPAGFNCTTPTVGTNGTVNCAGGTVDAGTSGAFELVVRVAPGTAAGTTLSNTATASASTPEANPGDESATSTTTVNTAADVAATVTGAPDPVSSGADLTYTIGVQNNGPSDAANVSLADTLPPGTTFTSLTAPAGFTCMAPAVGAAGSVNCSASTLAAGATPTFTLVVHVSSATPAGSTLSNTVTTSSTTADPAAGNGSATATTQVQRSADLAVTSAGSPDPVVAGTNLTYTLGVTNNGPSPAGNVTLSDDVPSGTSFVSMSTPPGFSCTTPAVGAGGNVKCTASSLDSGASATFTLVVHVGASQPDGSTLSNTATVGSTDSDPNAGNDSATSATAVGTSADLSTSVTDSADPVAAGGVVTYHVRVQNSGPSDSAQPRVAMPIPAETTLVGAAQTDGSEFQCTSDGSSVTCGASSLAAASGASIDVAVRTGRGQSGSITLRPDASEATGDPDGSNNASSESTRVTAAPPNRLTIGRTVGKRRSGLIVVALGCRSFATDTCKTTLTLTFRKPNQDLQRITTKATVKSGARKLVYLIASRAERRQIKRIRRLPVRVTATNPPGPNVVRDATILGTQR
jgi:uncharacterized repeat protein (TIGR01451 family)